MRRPHPSHLLGSLSLLTAFLFSCADNASAPPPQAAPGTPPVGYAQPTYAQPAYGQPVYAQPVYAQPAYYPPGTPAPVGYGPAPAQGAPPAQAYGPAPAQAPPPPYAPAPGPPPAAAVPAPPPPSASPVRPLLGPLLGSLAWQAEVRAVVRELISNLSPQNAARVTTIPLVFDPNPNEVNAFAGCDDNGSPFVAGTEGLLEAVDGIAQTRATDELFGTQTYGAYISVVAPRLVSTDNSSAALPMGVIPPQYWLDPRRISRAHEMFDEIVAFTFGHELSHHYLGHTGCANGQSGGAGPAIAQLGQLATAIAPGLNQPNEIMADTNGCINTLDTGRARAGHAYRWTEAGGLALLDFFSRLEAASGANPLLGFLRTHPNPGLRIPIVQTVAATWRFRNPG